MKTQIETLFHSFRGSLCTGTLLLITYSVSAQNLFVGSYGGQSIVEFPTGGGSSTLASGLDFPGAVAFDNAGDLFEADTLSGKIYKYAYNGTLSGSATLFASGLADPRSIAFDNQGNMFVACQGSDNVIEYFVGGGQTTYASIIQASGLAFDRAGDLFVTGLANQNASSGIIAEITPAKVQTTIASSLQNPAALAFNSSGDLFVSETVGTHNGQILEIAPGQSPTPYASGLNQPFGLAFDNAGDLFVADGGVNSENGDITKFTPGGSESVFSTLPSKPISLAFQNVALPVPEPSVFAMLACGAVVLFRYRRK
jgi:hypothetical protein